jgi:hypothetical protein
MARPHCDTPLVLIIYNSPSQTHSYVQEKKYIYIMYSPCNSTFDIWCSVTWFLGTTWNHTCGVATLFLYTPTQLYWKKHNTHKQWLWCRACYERPSYLKVDSWDPLHKSQIIAQQSKERCQRKGGKATVTIHWT